MKSTQIHGVAAAFNSPEAMLRAAKAVRKEGYSRVEAYTPFPVRY